MDGDGRVCGQAGGARVSMAGHPITARPWQLNLETALVVVAAAASN